MLPTRLLCTCMARHSRAPAATACTCWLRAHPCPVPPSALGVLASSSGVSSERKIFMDLVKTEIGRLNKQLITKGTVSLVFHAGGVQVLP